MLSIGKTCNYPGCGKNTPYTDWTRCEEHNGWLTAADVTDGLIDDLLEIALATDDIELVDLCETVGKMIVQPSIKRAACERIAEIVNKRTDNYDGPKDDESWSGGFAENH